MRANIRHIANSRPETFLERKVDHGFALALSEGTNPWKNISDSEKKLLALGRLSQRDFALAACLDPTAYESFWRDLANAAPGAHFSPRGKPGPTCYLITSLHAITAVEDMPKVEKVIAEFNSRKRKEEAQPTFRVRVRVRVQQAVLGVFVFGVLGGGARDEFAEPALDQKRSEVERVLFLYSKGFGLIEICQ